MKRINMRRFIHGLFVILQIILALCIVIGLLSQGKRFIREKHHVYAPKELTYEVSKSKPKKYVCYEKEEKNKEKEDTDGLVLLCIGETACYWSQEDMKDYVSDNTIETSITTLTFSVKKEGLDRVLGKDNSITYVKYGCQGEDSFSEEEVEYYKELAARRLTYNTYEEWGFKEADAYKDFVANENFY